MNLSGRVLQLSKITVVNNSIKTKRIVPEQSMWKVTQSHQNKKTSPNMGYELKSLFL